MKLYYAPGTCSLAIHIALREAGRTFELERVDVRTHRTATGVDLRVIHPRGEVPVLELDGADTMRLAEVSAILQYVADLAPERQLAPPNGTLGRYVLQEWLSFIATEVDAAFEPLKHPETPPATVARAHIRLAEQFVYLDGVLAERVHLMGEMFTVADAYLFVPLRWCERYAIDLQRTRRLADYFERVLHRPTVQAAFAAEGLLEPRRIHRSA